MVLGTLILAAGIASLAVTETTGKGVGDHVVSAYNGQDCRSLRMFKGEPVCQDEVRSSVTVTGAKEPVTVVNSHNNSVADMEAIFARRKASPKWNWSS